MSVIAIIPARYASTRFPGKPLTLIKGKSMIQRVYEQTKKCEQLQEVLIATDDERIASHALDFGAKVELTRPEHPSGTDRCFEAYQKQGRHFDYVINVQGDEPFINPEQIASLIQVCDGKVEIATQMIRCLDEETLFNPGIVKITLNKNKEALYFSRSVIPHLRGKKEAEWPGSFPYYRHVGMYAYRSDVLEQLTRLQPSSLELAESLEQLRWLENGYRITCDETTYESHCVDTPEDVEKVIRLMNL